VGQCEAPSFESAGAHLNPAARQHGLENPAGAHAGDLPNLTVSAAGEGRVDLTTARTMMTELLDADGTAIVVHAAADDQRTDPSGNSGARIACGVVR
jgi:Cu-Zn family superoxide dismutase